MRDDGRVTWWIRPTVAPPPLIPTVLIPTVLMPTVLIPAVLLPTVLVPTAPTVARGRRWGPSPFST